MIACGNRTHRAEIRPSYQHHHNDAAEVRLCFATEGGLDSLEDEEQAYYAEQEAEAEWRADRAAERYWEERGGSYEPDEYRF